MRYNNSVLVIEWDPFEIPEDNSVTPIESVPIQENIEKNPDIINCPSEAGHDNSPMEIVDVVFRKQSLKIETRNNDNSSAKTVSSTQNDVLVTQKEIELNQKMSEIIKNVVNCKAPAELTSKDNDNNLSLETNAIMKKPKNIFRPRKLKGIDANFDPIRHDEQYHNRKRLRKCFVKIQKLPRKFVGLAKTISKESVCDRAGNTWDIREKSMVNKKYYSVQKPINRHVESSVHDGKKSFLCNDCGKTFFLKHVLNVHIKSVHERKEALQM